MTSSNPETATTKASLTRRAKSPEATPVPSIAPPTPASDAKGKIAKLVALLIQPGGASIASMMAATGWQAHSVRGALSGAIKKKLGFNVISEKTEAGRAYRIASEIAE